MERRRERAARLVFSSVAWLASWARFAAAGGEDPGRVSGQTLAGRAVIRPAPDRRRAGVALHRTTAWDYAGPQSPEGGGHVSAPLGCPPAHTPSWLCRRAGPACYQRRSAGAGPRGGGGLLRRRGWWPGGNHRHPRARDRRGGGPSARRDRKSVV